MKNRLLFRTALTIVFFLFSLGAETNGQNKSIKDKAASIGISREQPPGQTNVTSNVGVRSSTIAQSPEKRTGKKFDQLQFEQQVEKLNRISGQRTLLRNLDEAVKKAESEKTSRQALDIQKQKRLRIFGQTTRFYQAPPIRKPTSSFSSKSSVPTLVSNALINGKTSDSINVGEAFTLTFSFAPNTLSAITSVFLDTDGDGVATADDILLGNALFLDNDDNDENWQPGEYRITFSKNDILSYLVSSMIFEVNDYQSASSAVLTVRKQPTTSIVLGTMFPAKPWIACQVSGSQDFQIVFTDSAGKFFFYVDRQQTTQLGIQPFDLTGATNGYVPPQDTIVRIVSDTTHATITYTGATSFIEGYVKDQMGDGIENASVLTFGGSFQVMTKTDSSGYFKLGVKQGGWYLSANIPWTADYLYTLGYNYLTVPSNATVRKDLIFIKSNNSISGNVTFNGAGAAGIPVTTYTDSLYNYILSSGDGSYGIPVFKPSSGTKTYTVNCFVSEGYFVENSPQMNIQPGATNVNFAVKKVAGGLQGRITDINTGNGISDAYISVSPKL